MINFSALAALRVKLVDNDDAQGHSTSRIRFDTYISDSACYYGDARKQATGYTSYGGRWSYRYTYDTPVSGRGTIFATLTVYLNSYEFTDPGAQYYINESGTSMVMHLAGTVNQNTALGGWNGLPMLSLDFTDAAGYNASRYTELEAGTSAGYYTGADAIQVTYQNVN